MKTTVSLVKSALASVLFLVLVTSAEGQVIFNGSFEVGTDPGVSMPLASVDTTSITGWTLQSGDIDYIGSRWQAADGTRCLDLSGWVAGTMLQSVSGFSLGSSYRLSFWIAGNPEAGPITKSLTAKVGSISQDFFFNGAGRTGSNMGWVQQSMDFVATCSTMTVSFTSLQPGWAGPALDMVSLAQIPEPSTLSLAAILCSFWAIARNRRNKI